MKIFADRFKELRLEENITQSNLAKDLNVSASIISFWENDLREPTGANLVKIADYFNVSADFLLGRSDFY